jgi:hypothetical protein
MNSVDYRREGLTLDKMGLTDLGGKNVRALLHEGF